MKKGNIYKKLPDGAGEEVFEDIIRKENVLVERIVSTGQTTPEGKWYDQDKDEWVVLLKGRAELVFEENNESVSMIPGDYIFIPAHCRHRVEFTAPDEETIWLALHF